MTFNFKAFVVSGVAAIAFAAAPCVVRAQSTDWLPPFPPVLEQLNLTPEQQTQLAEVRQSTRTQLETLLSPEQREQFRAMMAQGGTLQQAIAAMNLSAEQQTQLGSIFNTVRQEATAILTDEQRQQLYNLIRDRMSEQRNPSSSGS